MSHRRQLSTLRRSGPTFSFTALARTLQVQRSPSARDPLEKKRSLLWAEWLHQEVLEPVPHRHIVVTIPRLLRPLFRRRRERLRDLARCAGDALGAYVQASLGEALRPGIVVSIATTGDLAQWHPHLHILATDDGFSVEETFHPLDHEGQELDSMVAEPPHSA